MTNCRIHFGRALYGSTNRRLWKRISNRPTIFPTIPNRTLIRSAVMFHFKDESFHAIDCLRYTGSSITPLALTSINGNGKTQQHQCICLWQCAIQWCMTIGVGTREARGHTPHFVQREAGPLTCALVNVLPALNQSIIQFIKQQRTKGHLQLASMYNNYSAQHTDFVYNININIKKRKKNRQFHY